MPAPIAQWLALLGNCSEPEQRQYVVEVHAPIRDGLRKAGFRVIDTSRVGGGFPDLIVHARRQVVLVECKTSRNKAGTVEPKRIEASQHAFATEWQGGAVVMATSPEQAVNLVQAALRMVGT